MGHEIEVWNKRFAGARSAKLAKALVAFNSNVDVIVLGVGQANEILATLTHHELEVIEKKSDKEPAAIHDLNDFFAALIHGIKTGKAILLHADAHLFEWFGRVFKPTEKRIGGQAGIMANQLSAFHDSVLAYSSLLSPLQASFFNKAVRFPITKGKTTSYPPAKSAARKQDATKINWIFEFKTGEKIKALNEHASPRANRLIVASVVPFTPVFENVDLKHIAKQVDVAFLAGFHQLHGKSEKALLPKIVSQIKELRNANKKLAVHWEFVPMEDNKAEKELLQGIGKAVQSFGLNEVEIVEILHSLGAKKESDQVKKNENAFTLYQGCTKILEVLKLERVHLHSYGFQLLLLRKPYAIAPEKARDALVFSSMVAALKALKGGEFVTRTEVKKYDLTPSATGFNQLRALEGGIDEERDKRHSSFVRKDLLEKGIFEFKDHYVIFVPAPVVQSKSTVGLGDVISSIALAAERG